MAPPGIVMGISMRFAVSLMEIPFLFWTRDRADHILRRNDVQERVGALAAQRLIRHSADEIADQTLY